MEDEKSQAKGSLPIIKDYLRSSEQKVFELIEKDQTLTTRKKKIINNSKSDENQVMVKATLPLVADFLNCDEKELMN